VPGTLVFFESPNRAADTLADLAQVLGSREAVLARELTKLHEVVRRGSLGDLAESAGRDPPKGEVVLLVAPPEAREATDDMIVERLTAALASESLRDAVKVVAEALKVPRTRVYDIALGLKRQGEPDDET
jgi:16S rRNA (cytidine1402-2'-O)-methyltransferase